MEYRTCEHCGANLDPGERCDCQQEQQGIRKIKSLQSRKEFAYGSNGRKETVAV